MSVSLSFCPSRHKRDVYQVSEALGHNIQNTRYTNKPLTKVMARQRGLWENELLDGLLMCCVAWPSALVCARLVRLKWRADRGTRTALNPTKNGETWD